MLSQPAGIYLKLSEKLPGLELGSSFFFSFKSDVDDESNDGPLRPCELPDRANCSG